MVRTEYIGVDIRADELVVKTFRGDEIIYAPARVLLTRAETVRPPRVNALFVGVEIAVCIRKSAA